MSPRRYLIVLRGAVETVETMKAFHLAPEVREQFSELQRRNFEAYFGADSGIRYGSGIVVSSSSSSTTSDRNCFVLDNRASLTLVRHAAAVADDDDRENDGRTGGPMGGPLSLLFSSSLSSSDGFLP